MDYLPFEVTEQSNGIEEHVAKKLRALSKNVALTKTQSKFFLIGIIDEGEDKDDDALQEMYDDFLQGSLPMMLIKKELERVDLKFTKSALIFLGLICDRPGNAKLYAIHVIDEARRKGQSEISCNWLSTIFPLGVFNNKDLEMVWDGQKVERLNDGSFMSDNLVDYPTAFNSLKR